MKNGQRGFTFIELLVAMAVGGMLLTGAVLAIFQTFGITKRDSVQVTALENIKSAAYWILQDGRKADSQFPDGSSAINLVDGGPAQDNLILNWTVWYDQNGNFITNGEYHRCKYFRSGIELKRVHGTYSPSAPLTNYNIPDSSFTWEPERRVGNYISGILFSLQSKIILSTITSSPEEKPESAEQKTYRVYLQSKEAAVQ